MQNNSAREEFSYELLSSLYRQETKAIGLVQTKGDIYQRMARLTQDATDAYVAARLKDPESTESESLRSRRKSIIQLCRSIKAIRANKVASMAVRAADGSNIDTKYLTPEELAFFKVIREKAGEFFEEVGH